MYVFFFSVEQDDPALWQPLVVAVVDDKSRRVNIMTSPVPEGLNVTEVEFNAVHGTTIISSARITSKEPRFTFPMKNKKADQIDMQVRICFVVAYFNIIFYCTSFTGV